MLIFWEPGALTSAPTGGYSLNIKFIMFLVVDDDCVRFLHHFFHFHIHWSIPTAFIPTISVLRVAFSSCVQTLAVSRWPNNSGLVLFDQRTKDCPQHSCLEGVSSANVELLLWARCFISFSPPSLKWFVFGLMHFHVAAQTAANLSILRVNWKIKHGSVCAVAQWKALLLSGIIILTMISVLSQTRISLKCSVDISLSKLERFVILKVQELSDHILIFSALHYFKDSFKYILCDCLFFPHYFTFIPQINSGKCFRKWPEVSCSLLVTEVRISWRLSRSALWNEENIEGQEVRRWGTWRLLKAVCCGVGCWFEPRQAHFDMMRVFLPTTHLSRCCLLTRYKVTQVELFALLCRLADELLFRQISWIKKLPFFCELSIEDYTCLLSSTWQELILLSCLTIYSGQIFGELADITAKYTPSDDELQGWVASA